MSGHSKWSTIKRKKGAADAKRGKIFTKIIKEIMISVREGGADPAGNARLRLAIQNAKGANMPKDNIDRAIKKASGADAEAYHEMTYEGYASNGIAVFVEGLTDNTNRTISTDHGPDASISRKYFPVVSCAAVVPLYDPISLANNAV